MDPRADTMTHLVPEVLAGYLDDDLTREERHEAELHLAACAECRQELADVRQLQQAQRSRRWWPVLIGLTAAAAVLFIVTLPKGTQRPSETRAGSGGEQRLGIVAPAPSAEVAPGPITFIWRSAGPAASYTLTLQEPDGRVVWSTAVAETVAVSPDSVESGAGRTWFWFVDAMLPDGRSLSTGVNRLRTSP